MNFQTFDLNLLRVLDAMLTARNTTRVGETVGLSQPAVSAALRRLRAHLADPLFVREGNALVPTDFALSLQEPVRSALLGLEGALTGGGRFDPALMDRSFVIGASDYFHAMLLPRLVARLSEAAPRVRLKLLPARTGDFLSMLTAGQFDLALSLARETPAWIASRHAFSASNLVAARRGHPLLAGLSWGSTLPLDLFCSLPQAIFSVTDAFTHFEDAELARRGLVRQVRVTVAGYHGVAGIVAQSDLLGVLPTRFALSVADSLGLVLYRLPFAQPLVDMLAYWRARDSTSREQNWLRERVLELLLPLDETEFPVGAAELARGAPNADH